MGRPLGLSGYGALSRRAGKPGAERQGCSHRALLRLPRFPEPDGVGQARRERLARPRQLHARHDALLPRQRAALHRSERRRRDRVHQHAVRREFDSAGLAGGHSQVQEPRALVRRRGDEDRLRAVRDAEPQSLRLERGARQGRQLRRPLLRNRRIESRGSIPRRPRSRNIASPISARRRSIPRYRRRTAASG